jgi:hypothetical protein
MDPNIVKPPAKKFHQHYANPEGFRPPCFQGLSAQGLAK